jgi:hypothetical protein
MFTALFRLLTTAIAPQVALLLAHELEAGSPLDKAVKTVVGQLSAQIPNVEARAIAVEALNGLVTVVEKLGSAAITGAVPAAQAPPGS